MSKTTTAIILVFIIIFIIVLYNTRVSWDVMNNNPGISESEHKQLVAYSFLKDFKEFFSGMFSILVSDQEKTNDQNNVSNKTFTNESALNNSPA